MSLWDFVGFRFGIRATLLTAQAQGDLPAAGSRHRRSRFSAEGQHQHVSIRGLARNDRVHRGDAMVHASIVDEGSVERSRQGECAESAAVGCVNGGRAAGDVVTANHQHQHEVDAIAMNSFRCRMAGATWLCLDAELVHLDARGTAGGREGSEQAMAEALQYVSAFA